MSKEVLTLNSQTVIGMVHCLPLPTTAGFDGDYQKIIDRAVQDAVTLEKAGVDAVIVENMGDTPFSALLNKAQIAALTAAAYAVKQAVKIPVGIDAAFNDCEADIAIAAMVGASFIRVPVFVDTVLFTDGIIQPCAKKCLEYRKMMGQEKVKIIAVFCPHTSTISKLCLFHHSKINRFCLTTCRPLSVHNGFWSDFEIFITIGIVNTEGMAKFMCSNP